MTWERLLLENQLDYLLYKILIYCTLHRRTKKRVECAGCAAHQQSVLRGNKFLEGTPYRIAPSHGSLKLLRSINEDPI